MTETAVERVEAESVDEATPYRVRLHTVDDIRVEMARVYRDVRGKRLTPTDGAKLIYMLSQVARVAEVARVEQRIDAVIAAMEKAGIPYVPAQS
ncbi:MAG: hypothetical protein KIT63_23840 [Rhodoferax sp.]|nr:hypothetical protein [Rhodoferax sp.]